MNSLHDVAAARLIELLGLQPHPEGGYYRETYRSGARVQAAAGARSVSTAIYYLLEAPAHSAWHRIAADEMWHFYAGDRLDVHVLEEDGRLTTLRLGYPLVDPDCGFQAVVPAGRWFAAELGRVPDGQRAGNGASPFALVGCTVAPGFEFSEFELADCAALMARYPQHVSIIRRLAR